MENPGIDLPPGAGLQPERAREIQNPVIAAAPLFETGAHVRFRRAGLETHERVRKIVERLVVLRRKVIRLRLAAAADAPGLLLALVHVVRNRAEVVEEFAEDVPPAFASHRR